MAKRGVNTGAACFKGLTNKYTTMKQGELKKACEDLFGGENISNPFIMKSLLEIDDVS